MSTSSIIAMGTILSHWMQRREKKERIALENQPVVLSPEQDEQGTMMAFGQSPNANTQSPERK